jgi:riboflavin kinase / FMN adenylyltransferase
MNVYRGLAELPVDFGPSALTIGNFDGLHCGHRRILARVRAIAAERGLKPSALTFDPHPTRVVAPERSPRLMTSPERRVELMAEEGIEQVLILPFTADLAHLAPERFAADVLAARLGARAVLVGRNFRFGYKQAGTPEVLAALGRELGFETEVVPSVVYRGRLVSSSGIRELVLAGDVSRAARILMRPFAMEGPVVSGRGVGSKQTVPTLNLQSETEIVPATGVYVTRTFEQGGARRWNSITNVGYRPTFGDTEGLSVETFLLDPLAGEDPGRIRVEFLRRVRPERKFETPEALRTQILRDVRAAQAFFRRVQAWTGLQPR